MSYTNHIQLTGNLVDDPVLRYTNSTGKPVVNARIAVNERINVGGEWRESTEFFNLVLWGSQAENFAGSVSKGVRVSVAGRLQTREYTKEAGGEKQYRTEIVVSEAAISTKFAIVQPVDIGHTVVEEVPA